MKLWCYSIEFLNFTSSKIEDSYYLRQKYEDARPCKITQVLYLLVEWNTLNIAHKPSCHILKVVVLCTYLKKHDHRRCWEYPPTPISPTSPGSTARGSRAASAASTILSSRTSTRQSPATMVSSSRRLGLLSGILLLKLYLWKESPLW